MFFPEMEGRDYQCFYRIGDYLALNRRTLSQFVTDQFGTSTPWLFVQEHRITCKVLHLLPKAVNV